MMTIRNLYFDLYILALFGVVFQEAGCKESPPEPVETKQESSVSQKTEPTPPLNERPRKKKKHEPQPIPPPRKGPFDPPPPNLLDWVKLAGGSYEMGSPEGEGEKDEYPRHRVDISSLEMLRTEVTVAQYKACLAVGACAPTFDKRYCNIVHENREDYPVNCVDWAQARDFCLWVGGRLPTEAEWEYAARNGGKDVEYPWGNEMPSCDLVVLDTEKGKKGCGRGTSWPVCSKKKSNTEHGLCDMIGNVYEWVDDWYHDSYEEAPTDGSAWNHPPSQTKIMRGCGIGSCLRTALDHRAMNRVYHGPEFRYGGLGIRCVR